MKKSLVAAGVIVALGVVWTGGAWFTGKQLEGRIADMVQQANAQLRSSAPESGLELSYQDYQRGLFSSHLQLVVKPIAGQANGWPPVRAWCLTKWSIMAPSRWPR